jgi:hypothetical protein
MLRPPQIPYSGALIYDFMYTGKRICGHSYITVLSALLSAAKIFTVRYRFEAGR